MALVERMTAPSPSPVWPDDATIERAAEATTVADRLAVAVARTALGAEAETMTDAEAVRTYDVRQRRGQSA